MAVRQGEDGTKVAGGSDEGEECCASSDECEEEEGKSAEYDSRAGRRGCGVGGGGGREGETFDETRGEIRTEDVEGEAEEGHGETEELGMLEGDAGVECGDEDGGESLEGVCEGVCKGVELFKKGERGELVGVEEECIEKNCKEWDGQRERGIEDEDEDE